jgi:hypothetical protein
LYIKQESRYRKLDELKETLLIVFDEIGLA